MTAWQDPEKERTENDIWLKQLLRDACLFAVGMLAYFTIVHFYPTGENLLQKSVIVTMLFFLARALLRA